MVIFFLLRVLWLLLRCSSSGWLLIFIVDQRGIAFIPCSPPTQPWISDIGTFNCLDNSYLSLKDSKFVPVLITKSAFEYLLQIIAIASTGFVITIYLACRFLGAVTSEICLIIFAFSIAKSLRFIFTPGVLGFPAEINIKSDSVTSSFVSQ